MRTHYFNGFKIVDETFKTLLVLLVVAIAGLGIASGFSSVVLPLLLMTLAAVLLADIFWLGAKH